MTTVAVPVPAISVAAPQALPQLNREALRNFAFIPQVLEEVAKPPQGNTARRERFIELLKQAGARPEEIVRTPIAGIADGEMNVVTRLAGTDAGAGAIVLGAHTDSVGEGEGAVDNWSGSVMLVALYKYCRTREFRHELIFAAFASEEHGGQGSEQFVKELCRGGAGAMPRAMVNLECLGVGLPRTWCNRSADALEDALARAGRELKIPVRRQALFGYTADSFSFDRAGVAAATVHSLSPAKLACINGPRDTTALLDRRNYRLAYVLLRRALALLDEQGAEVAKTDKERTLEPLPLTLHWHSGDLPGGGVEVRALPPLGPERQAGLREGDVISSVDGTPVRNRDDLHSVLLSLHRGLTVPVWVKRKSGDGEQEIRVDVAY